MVRTHSVSKIAVTPWRARHMSGTETTLTHAGGVAYRRSADGAYQVLLVRARRPPHEWVLPKGHIEPGETPAQTARRELIEEAGIDAEPELELGHATFVVRGKQVRAVFYLMEYRVTRPSHEDREIRWCTFSEALRLTPFENAQSLLRAAMSTLAR
jgi:8-oxo-dGTP pyrophosphatase MutT (NUDIX family)